MRKERTTTMSAAIPLSLASLIEEEAGHERISMSELIRSILVQHFDASRAAGSQELDFEGNSASEAPDA